VSDDQILAHLIAKGEEWVLKQHALHHPSGNPLEPHLKADLQRFFDAEILNEVRVVSVPQIPNPDFYDDLKAAGLEIPPNFSEARGAAFLNTIVLSEHYRDSWSPSLYFHELVHVVQYRILGVSDFMKRYVKGWAENGFRYELIPLEQDAYELQKLYEDNPLRSFIAKKHIARKLQEPSKVVMLKPFR
jgi:hypothetical protein